MTARNQFLNHDVWDTMTTADVAPTSSINTRISA
jgi:hypothetical protein